MSYSLLLCVSPVGVLHWSLRSGTVDNVVFSDFLNRLPDGITLVLDNAKIHHATKSLIERDLPTVKQLAASKSITLKYTPPYAPHLNPVEFCFNTVRSELRKQKAWTEAKLVEAIQVIFRADKFSESSMDKLFKSINIIWGSAEVGVRAKVHTDV